MPGHLVCINMHGEAHDSPSMSYQNHSLFVCMLMRSIWAMLSTYVVFASQTWANPGVCVMSKTNELPSSLFTLSLNLDLLLASAISNHHLIFCPMFSLHLSPCLLQRFSFSISLSVFLLFCLLCKPVAHPMVSSQPLLSSCLQLLVSATIVWISSNTFLCSPLLPDTHPYSPLQL